MKPKQQKTKAVYTHARSLIRVRAYTVAMTRANKVNKTQYQTTYSAHIVHTLALNACG